MAQGIMDKVNEYIKDIRNDDVKTIVIGLFALIGFIILVYAIFAGIVGESVSAVADTVFVAVLVGLFTLVGIIIGQSMRKK